MFFNGLICLFSSRFIRQVVLMLLCDLVHDVQSVEIKYEI